MAEIVGEYLDRLCTLEMRPGKGNLPRGVIHCLYDAARSKFGRPLTFDMAQALQEKVAAGDYVFIVTGAGGPPVLPKGEVDGLLGAVALARALHFGLGARTVILTEDHVAEPVRAATRAAGLNFATPVDPGMDHAVTFISMPLDRQASQEQAITLLREYAPKAVIAIEKLSPNQKGVIHGATGLNYDDEHTKAHFLFEGAEREGILTCGIGDGGNEIGFGVIREAVAEIMPAGRVCACPCEGGTAASVSTDRFVVAAISDWGGYSVAGMLAYLIGNLNVLIDEQDIERMLRATVDAGALDGAIGRPTLSDDGVPLKTHQAFITMLRSIISIAGSTLASPGH